MVSLLHRATIKELGQLALLAPRCGGHSITYNAHNRGEWRVEPLVFFLLTMVPKLS